MRNPRYFPERLLKLGPLPGRSSGANTCGPKAAERAAADAEDQSHGGASAHPHRSA